MLKVLKVLKVLEVLEVLEVLAGAAGPGAGWRAAFGDGEAAEANRAVTSGNRRAAPAV